jgi:hypothetical protein
VEEEIKRRLFVITHRGTRIELESEVRQADSLKALLSAVFFSFRKKYPDKLDMLMGHFNAMYAAALKEEALKEAKKMGQELPAMDEPEPDTFQFYKWLMESRWYEVMK